MIQHIALDRSAQEAMNTASLDPWTDAYDPKLRKSDRWAWLMGRGLPVGEMHDMFATGGFLIHGLEVNVPCTTPSDGRRPYRKRPLTEGYLNAVATLLDAHPVAFAGEKEGELIHQIVPIQGDENSLSNRGAEPFDFHIEGPHLDLPPCGLMLMCIRNREQGPTSVFDLGAMFDAAPKWVRDGAKKADFAFQSGASYANPVTRMLALMEGAGPDARYRLNLDYMYGTTPEAMAVEEWVRTAMHDEDSPHRQQFTLQPGQLLVINNRRMAHARDGFTPMYDGYQRWLQRMYITRFPLRGAAGDPRWPHVWSPTFSD